VSGLPNEGEAVSLKLLIGPAVTPPTQLTQKSDIRPFTTTDAVGHRWPDTLARMSVPIRLMEESRARLSSPMRPRELKVHLLVGFPFVVVAALLPVFALDRSVHATDVLIFVVATALMGRLEFETGAGLMVPTQLLFVPMLFVLPPAIVPLVVAAAQTLDRLPEVLTGRLHPQRLLAVPSDAWFAVGPAAVFLLAGVHEPVWSDWPLYLCALAAQFACDTLSSTARERLAHGVAPKLQLDVLREIWLVDALLTPLGLLAAFASVTRHYAFLFVLPLAFLLAIFARERRGRIGTAIELSATYRGTALLLGDVISSDDELTGLHSQGAVVLALAIADELQLDEDERRLVELASMLHDIGKMETPREILHKPGPLSAEEWLQMRTHTIAGQRMLDRVGGTLHDVGLIVRSARERYAGDGYPDALAGPQIPIAARVVAVAAAYSAMTTRRPYRPALAPSAALTELRAGSGTQFDPGVVEAARAVLARGVPDPRAVVADNS
jgi:HD-GYP domain-containing protein (c-di-GMP phosphodiesterase class II)